MGKLHKLANYEEIDLRFTADGSPLCPDCGSIMIYSCNEWECHNSSCSVIGLRGKRGKYKVVRDTIMSGWLSGHAAVLEV